MGLPRTTDLATVVKLNLGFELFRNVTWKLFGPSIYLLVFNILLVLVVLLVLMQKGSSSIVGVVGGVVLVGGGPWTTKLLSAQLAWCELGDDFSSILHEKNVQTRPS